MVPPLLVAVCGSITMGWLGLGDISFTDYEQEAKPALMGLRAGDWREFLALLPAYGGSLILRSPFALLPKLWDGGQLSLFRSMAAPCLAAGAALGVTLWARAHEHKLKPAAGYLALAVCVLNPITLRALEYGHPEELLGGVLCVAAVIAATRDRVLCAGVLLGLAVANKPWAMLAAVPVLVALSRGRPRMLLVACAVSAALVAPMAVGGAAPIGEVRSAATTTGHLFQPWQVWWFAGNRSQEVAARPGYRVPPGWLSGLGHPLVMAFGLVVALAGARRLRGRPPENALLLLALVLLARCLLDPWNITYYSLPFLLALAAWEVSGARRAPIAAAAATLLTWVSFEQLPDLVSSDAQASFYLAWTIPLAVAIGWRIFRPEGELEPSRAVHTRGPQTASLPGPSSTA